MTGRIRHAALVVCATVLATAWPGTARAQAEFVGAYDYPFVNPLVATVIKTPIAYQIEGLPDFVQDVNVDRRVLAPPADQSIPQVFWYDQAGMLYGLAYQDRPAPLVVLIAGTGGGFDSATTVEMARVLFRGGNHVLSIPSPTFTNFLTTYSTTHVPGRLADDARDLYTAIGKAIDTVRGRISFTDIHLTGYSLGGIHAAFVAKLDADERKLGFKRILVVNPPVGLYNSVSILDQMLDRNVEPTPEALNELAERVFQRFAAIYDRASALDLSGDFLYAFYRAEQPTNAQLETVIGLSFRFSATNLAFVSDVMTDSGYLVPKTVELGATSSLTPYLRDGVQRTFVDFFNAVYVPYFQRSDPSLTRDRAIFDASLHAIDGYLRSAENVGLMTNADDIILARGEIDYLAELFGDRAVIFPTGGHCGNFLQRDFATRMIQFFAQ